MVNVMVRIGVSVLALVALMGCAADPVWAPDDDVQKSFYAHPGPKYITLYTMKNVGSGNGAHTSLLINASQRIMWDPSGTFKHPQMPERNDVIFGMSPPALNVYVDYHSRAEYYTVARTIEVPADVAEDLMRRAMGYGAVMNAYCTTSTAILLRDTPGFEDLRQSFFPNNLDAQFAKLPGVVTEEFRDNDPDKEAALRRHVTF